MYETDSCRRFLGVCLVLLLAHTAVAEDPAVTAPSTAAESPTADAVQAKAAFDKNLADYKAAIREIEQLRIQYQSADEAARKKINAELTGHVAHTQSLVNALVDSAISTYRAAPNADPQVKELLVAVARYESMGRALPNSKDQTDGGDQYEKALPIIQALVASGEQDRDLLLLGFLSAFATNDYDLAEEFLKKAQAAEPKENPSDSDAAQQNMFRLVSVFAPALDEYRAKWEKESAIREKEAAADDLPRVKLTTSKGEITLELFENEAPQAVANFLTLVKDGFYDGSPFHRVLPAFMAQGGAKTDDGEGGPGYVIRCECHEPDARMHFRGSLSMAHAGRDTGNSQFFLTFVPTPHLDGKHTVFGRVIEGMEVLGDLTRRNPQLGNQPASDRIIKAEVLRDRGHEYAFEKLPDR
jgi:cyclophilin family peptidyl-prolyl cis-trans isomerase